MRILCLTDAFWPDQAGGISKAVLFETQELIRMGHEVVVVSRRLSKEAPTKERREGFELHRFPAPPVKSALGPAYPVATILNLPRVLCALNASGAFDVAYVNNVFQARALLRSGIDVPMVYVFHASAYREVSIDIINGRYGKLTALAKLANSMVKPIERIVLERADAVIVRSGYMGDEIKSLHGSNRLCAFQQIPLCVDTDRFPFALDPLAARRSLGLPGDRRIILTVRRLVARMGLDNLIAAMSLVSKQCPQSKLLICGTGYLDASLRKAIRERGLDDFVEMPGFVSEELLPLYYQAADLFVLPTQAYEGFGMATLEALSCGTPVIVTPVGANPAVVAPLDRRLVAAGTGAEDIAGAVLRWFDQDGALVPRSTCRSYCVANFSLRTVCGQIEAVLNQVREAHRLEGRTRLK